jgi:chromosome segregation ATPase
MKAMDNETKQFIVEQMQGLHADIGDLGKRLYLVESRLDSKIEALGERLDTVEDHLGSLGSQIEDVSKRLDAAEGRLGSQIAEMDERLERVEKFSSDTFDIVSGRLKAVEGKVGIRYVAPEMAQE